ncbi:MAG: decarboxylase [Lachnospiraceae bacterium]|nr:decarboxylase [Lachnospiraceae bacterium]
MPKLYERLTAYGNSNVYPLHMPGHKRKGEKFSFGNPFTIDITEIDGFDNLHHPTGILKEAMENAAAVYGVEKSYFLVNGSSCGILAAISACVSFGGKLLVARNCHKSVYHGMILQRIAPVYLCPDMVSGWGMSSAVSPEMVEDALLKNPEVEAVLITSPTYEGIVSDIRGICEISHKHGIPVIVDAAHGAHFSFWDICESASFCGADLVVESLHKTLPSLTQTAILHKNSLWVDETRLEWYLQVYQTSSPSYVLMASMDSCIGYAAGKEGKEDMASYVGELQDFRKKMEALSHTEILSEGEAGGFSYDISKLVIRAAGWSGKELYEKLRRDYQIQPEMCTENYVVLMTSMADNSVVFHHLFAAFVDINKKCSGNCGKLKEKKDDFQPFPEPQVVLIPALAIEKKKIPFSLEQCEGRISGEFAYLYPPGIPILVSGERVTLQVIETLKRYEKKGFEVLGPKNFEAGELLTIEEEVEDFG